VTVGDLTGIVDLAVTILGAIITAVGIVFAALSMRWRRQDRDEAAAPSLQQRRAFDGDTRQQFRVGLSLGVGLVVAGLCLLVVGLVL
jgi:uncharacterized membrane protein